MQQHNQPKSGGQTTAGQLIRAFLAVFLLVAPGVIPALWGQAPDTTRKDSMATTKPDSAKEAPVVIQPPERIEYPPVEDRALVLVAGMVLLLGFGALLRLKMKEADGSAALD